VQTRCLKWRYPSDSDGADLGRKGSLSEGWEGTSNEKPTQADTEYTPLARAARVTAGRMAAMQAVASQTARCTVPFSGVPNYSAVDGRSAQHDHSDSSLTCNNSTVDICGSPGHRPVPPAAINTFMDSSQPTALLQLSTSRSSGSSMPARTTGSLRCESCEDFVEYVAVLSQATDSSQGEVLKVLSSPAKKTKHEDDEGNADNEKENEEEVEETESEHLVWKNLVCTRLEDEEGRLDAGDPMEREGIHVVDINPALDANQDEASCEVCLWTAPNPETEEQQQQQEEGEEEEEEEEVEEQGSADVQQGPDSCGNCASGDCSGTGSTF